jgi:hypothetical protein
MLKEEPLERYMVQRQLQYKIVSQFFNILPTSKTHHLIAHVSLEEAVHSDLPKVGISEYVIDAVDARVRQDVLISTGNTL